MLFDQGNVNIGLAHRSYFGWHLGAARHEQVALFQFLQPRAKIKAQQPGQCHRKIGVAVGVHRQLAGFKAFLTYDAFNGHASLALIEHEGLCVKDSPAVAYMGVDANGGRVAPGIKPGLPYPLGCLHAHHVRRRQV